jgi:penicillin-binding protein 2
MLIFDEQKKNDPQLRLVAMIFAGGLGILLAGLWWVQVVSARKYQSHLETQAYRTVRIPAVRGKILDCEGRVLAENRADYNLSIYLDDLGSQFQKEYDRLRPVKIVTNSPPLWKFWLGSKSVVTKRARLTQSQIDALTWQARDNVANNLVAQMSAQLQQPLGFDPKNFAIAYEKKRALPYPVLKNLDETQIARFEEHYSGGFGADLEVQPARIYPSGESAAHVLGYLRSDDSSAEGEDAYFSYRLPDYRGVEGIEGEFDSQLRGRAGEESMLVNNLGYRQSENMLDAPEPGENVVLTIDADIQRAAEKSFLDHQGADARGAVVVMDVRSGNVLAMVSSPAFDPNDYIQGFTTQEFARLNDETLRPQINRATQQNYAPGSIFKTVVALAALENGLDPNEVYDVQPNPENPARGMIFVGKRAIKDTAPPGEYNFQRAFIHSSNSYFITNGLRAGIENILKIAEKFHLGERTGILPGQETRGIFPAEKRIHSRGWHDGDTANVCIGQGEVAVTPIQMAVMVSAIANGGKILWPRLIDRIEPQDLTSGESATNFPSGLIRDELDVHPRSLEILRSAMLADVESSEGTGTAAAVNGLQICGKTGTAQVQDVKNQLIGWNYWFASFAPFENPKYAVVVMVESQNSGSGGSVCAPIAHDIYEEILKKENARQKNPAIAKN